MKSINTTQLELDWLINEVKMGMMSEEVNFIEMHPHKGLTELIMARFVTILFYYIIVLGKYINPTISFILSLNDSRCN